MSDPTVQMVDSETLFGPVIALNRTFVEAVGAPLTVPKLGKTLGTAGKGEIIPEELQDPMAGGQEMAQLEGSKGGTL